MSLTKYKTKRNFKASPEPVGGRAVKNELRFVVQKHDATRLHYDVRLEMEGVLKSWAVPKGPSTDPRVKRLAMRVEDHPYDYRDFEGTIPSGYGAGTVMVWDEGTYMPADFDKTDKTSQDKYLRAGLKAGKLHVILKGKKLKGEFALVKTQGMEKNAWLMFKVKDQFASTDDITLKDKSVISNKTLAGIEGRKDAGKGKYAGKGNTKKTAGNSSGTSAKSMVTPAGKSARKTLLNPSEETQVKKINGHDMKFTNLSKIYWPKEKITKRDMLNYYYQVAPYILPYLEDRPQSMNRHPDGIAGESFYFKDVTGKAPEWAELYLYHSEADSRDRHYLVAKDEASLLYMASLGCIEMNPWHSKVQTEDYPDWCIIDLDPAKNTFDQVIEAAIVTKNILDSMGIKGYPKTSGSTGMHVYIPLGAKYTYDQSKEFTRVIATLVQSELPSFTSIERIVSKRKGKMYVDFLQNRPQATVSAPYSLRPKPGATVSMPLYWEEVKKGLKMADFNIYNAMDRIKSEGDIFKPVLGKGINLEKVISSFTK